jgi:Peroxisomal biogenesis factor 11 (PEX11)
LNKALLSGAASAQDAPTELVQYKHRLQTLNNVMGAMGMCRKVLKFGKLFQLYRSIKNTTNVSSPTAALQLLSKYVDVVFTSLDHWMWAVKVGFIQPDKDTLQRYSDLQQWMWFTNMIISTILNIRKFLQARRELSTLEKSTSQSEFEGDDEKASKRRREAIKNLSDATRTLFKNSLDIVLCLYLLRKITISYRDSGVLGFITSAIGVWEAWP